MKVYLAAPWSERLHMQAVAWMLTRVGFEVTSRWLSSHVEAPEGASVEDYEQEWAMNDVLAIEAADVLCVTTIAPANGGGRYVEMGMALRAGKPVIAVGPARNVFCRLPEVELAPTWERAIARLCEMRGDAIEASANLDWTGA